MDAHRGDGTSCFSGYEPGARGPASLLAVLALVSGCTRDDARERGVGEVANELRVCPSESTVPGIDVSVYQGRIDWDRVASSGIGFGIARIGDGLVRDDATFGANWSGMKAAGLVRGAYQYFEASEDPEAEADRVVAKVGHLVPGDLPVALDLETADGEPADEVLRRAEIWIARVTVGTGKPPLIYTAKYFWDGIPDGADLAASPLWVAHFGVACPDLPSAWNRWRLWQNGDTSAIPGVSVSVDHDVFDGTLSELRAFAGESPSTARGGDAAETDGATARADASTAEPIQDGRSNGAESLSDASAKEPTRDGAARASMDASARSPGLRADARAPFPAPNDAPRASSVNDSDASTGAPCDSGLVYRDAGCACRLARPASRRGSGAWIAPLLLAIAELRRRRRDPRAPVERRPKRTLRELR